MFTIEKSNVLYYERYILGRWMRDITLFYIFVLYNDITYDKFKYYIRTFMRV